MSRFEQQQSERESKKQDQKEADKASRENLGKYYYDLSKLTFATSVLNGSGFIFGDINQEDRWLIVVMGIIFTIIFATLGYRTINHSTFASF